MGAVEFQFTGADRTVHSQIVRASEPVSAELPGNLAAAAGTLLRRLASEGITRTARSAMTGVVPFDSEVHFFTAFCTSPPTVLLVRGCASASPKVPTRVLHCFGRRVNSTTLDS